MALVHAAQVAHVHGHHPACYEMVGRQQWQSNPRAVCPSLTFSIPAWLLLLLGAEVDLLFHS